ncbi:MAG: outer membrane protein transport protein [Rhodobacteraceae bacterium]|nr:outer membrane protein transport protein [Paracoccaceae bacterium]
MRQIIASAGAACLCATIAQAGGIERGANDYGKLFDSGNQFTFSLAHVTPRVSGTYSEDALAAAALTGVGAGVTETGSMAESYTTMSVAYTNDFSEKLTFGLFQNDAYGANASYTAGFYTGLQADWKSDQLAAILRYQLADRISVLGGLRYVQSEAVITIPDQLIRAATLGQAQDAADAAAAAAEAGDLVLAATLTAQATLLNDIATTTPAGGLTYNAQGEKRGDLGYVLGFAYEIPEIALRVALTWESEVEHNFDSAEQLAGFGVDVTNNTRVTMPQSLALDFQTGIAQNTLLFGQVKWTEWSKWEVRTPEYETITGGAVTGFDNDTITWQVGVGRRFSEAVSGFAQVTYEKANGGEASRLSPTDGSLSLGIGAQYTNANVKLRGGLQYVKIGDAVVADGSRFEGNSAIAAGGSLTLTF